ncbi:MAG TPA: hypothetical protein VD965_08275 [Burkholderiales bacterium]|nr:hypothetical protein [Burkholderiales bacterium]
MGALGVYHKAIRRAAEIAGGAFPLSLALDVPVDDVHAWLAGERRPDDTVFLRAVDIILGNDGAVPWTSAELEEELLARNRRAG